jgi:Amt family ammonium transporter
LDTDILFELIAAGMLLVMYIGFAFREAGSVHTKNQANAFAKAAALLAIVGITYTVLGYYIAHGQSFRVVVSNSPEQVGGSVLRFLHFLTFAAAVPAIVAGALAERARFWPQIMAALVVVGLVYPFYEGIVWSGHLRVQQLLSSSFGAEFHDFSGSILVHAMGGWLALAAVMLLGPREGRFDKLGKPRAMMRSSLPYFVLGSWMLILVWLGLNITSTVSTPGLSGMVTMNSLMAITGGLLGALVVSKNNPWLVQSGGLAGLVAICAGSDVVHPIASVVIGVLAGIIFVVAFNYCRSHWKIDDVVGAWPLHGLCGAWGGLACGIFSSPQVGGQGGVAFMSQVVGTLGGIGVAIVSGFGIYGLLRRGVGIRLTKKEEHEGADSVVHRIEPDGDL